MKTTYFAAIAFALTSIVAGQAMAADNAVEGKTREQVRAELTEAQRTGDIRVGTNYGDLMGNGPSAKLNEINPGFYAPANQVAAPSATPVRAQAENVSRADAPFGKQVW